MFGKTGKRKKECCCCLFRKHLKLEMSPLRAGPRRNVFKSGMHHVAATASFTVVSGKKVSLLTATATSEAVKSIDLVRAAICATSKSCHSPISPSIIPFVPGC